MSFDLDDTIVAIASAAGPALRGVVRLSGPEVAKCLRSVLVDAESHPLELPLAGAPPRRVAVSFSTPAVEIDGDLLYWPGTRSYTRQPSAELHMIGSPPLLAAVVDEFCRHGARPAGPGEFTLRAFAAGRIDLTQAEGVLGVIDARGEAELESALGQLAGGMSRPLADLRDELLDLLAELEAGLDFADEQIEFVDRPTMHRQFSAAAGTVATIAAQLHERSHDAAAPRVVLVGPPNAGKSSLLNALAARFATSAATPAIVSPTPGATRDFVVAQVEFDGVACELVDTAGVDTHRDGAIAPSSPSVAAAAQAVAREQRRQADLRVYCQAADLPAAPIDGDATLGVLTKFDLLPRFPPARDEQPSAIPCSAVTGEGLGDLAAEIAARARVLLPDITTASFAAATAQRCRASLAEASRALESAIALVGAGREELLSAEVRAASDAVGEVLGATCADDVLDRVFTRFCIGK